MTGRLEAELIGVLGDEGYLALVEAVGGQLTYVPKSASGTVLAGQIGDAYAELLSASYGGEHLDVPLSRPFRARQFYAQGKSAKDICNHLTMTERNFYQILAAMDPEEKARGQFDLFDRTG